MVRLLRALCSRDDGYIEATGTMLLASILVIGLVAGLTSISASLNEELGDVGAAASSLNQSYSFSGMSGTGGFIGGSTFNDVPEPGRRRVMYCDLHERCGDQRVVNKTCGGSANFLLDSPRGLF